MLRISEGMKPQKNYDEWQPFHSKSPEKIRDLHAIKDSKQRFLNTRKTECCCLLSSRHALLWLNWKDRFSAVIPVNLVPYAPCVLGFVLDMQRAEVQDCHVHQEDANVELDVSREARPRACAVMLLHGVHRKIFGERVCTHNYFFTLERVDKLVLH